jgi:hypothetical protein
VYICFRVIPPKRASRFELNIGSLKLPVLPLNYALYIYLLLICLLRLLYKYCKATINKYKIKNMIKNYAF